MNARIDFNALPDRFRQKTIIEPNSGCWLWTGLCVRKGYGQTYFSGKQWAAHRFAFWFFNGFVPDQLDHLCKCKVCVNPLHLEAVTTEENVRRHWVGFIPATHCSRGHKYDFRVGNQGVCRICRNAAQRARRHDVRHDLDELGAWAGD
jgi:hypothetical protein